MNYSEIKPQIYTYLGFHGLPSSSETDSLIACCLNELEALHRFRYHYERFAALPPPFCKDPYISFIQGCSGVILSAMTLGTEVDRRIKYLGRTDMTKSVVFDACASALLEKLSDDFEKGLAEEVTYRFCPGYGGSDLSDVRDIFRLIKPEKVGIVLTDENYLLPSKSMAGLVGVGKTSKKRCGSCILLAHCGYRKEGKRCYGSEEK